MSTTTVTGFSTPDDDDMPDNVHVLRPHVSDTVGPGTEIEPAGDIVDAELVTPAQEAELAQRRAAIALRQAGNVARVVRGGATHPHTKAVARASASLLVTTAQGHASWARRAVDALTHAHVREQIASARAGNDREALAEWTDRLVDLKKARAERLRALPATIRAALVSLLVAVVVLAGILLVAGIAFQLTPGGLDWDSWWELLGEIAGVLGMIATVAVHVAVWGAVPAWLAFAWREGKRRVMAPAWMGASDDAPTERDVVPDEGAILNALRNLNLPALNKKFKEGWKPRWVSGSAYDGRGWRTQLLLPEGVTVEMIVDRKDVLAHNLLRLPVEVWPTEPKNQPGVLDLWVADQGSLTKPVDPFPLLTEGTTDYFRGVPVGINPQGKIVLGRLFQANWGVAGMMGSGKSTLIISALLGAMLDPLVEIDVYCMAFNADYDPLAPRLRTLFKSDEPDQIPVVLEALKKLMSELSERGRILSEMGEPKLTRKLAAADPRMRPRVVVIDECQELFVSDIGEEAAELVEKIVAKARKYGVTMLFATPVPSADSLPRKVAKVLSNKACFAIGDHQGNDAILGTGKHKAGITATTLRPMTEDSDGTVDTGDIGTAMTVGFMPIDGLMRCFYVRRGEGVDEVTPVVKRALALREGTVPQAPAIPAGDTDVDHLADVAAVLAGRTVVKQQEVLGLLALHNPAVYTEWSAAELRAALPEAARPYKTMGAMHLNADRVAAALAARDADTETDTDSDGPEDEA
ncbi:zonular occludens toxin domain-containing protein [Kutzneria chonburiensis]|uniref:Zonular occludens toxin domain-containing protein n=1 Tax=Kutzneria chonburiensis TaxID=1483604 RepID=A0ABV6N3R7_9PSEU|nr:zonular occludens toxin domain-containing protein [Kutzneria chonburiensis]